MQRRRTFAILALACLSGLAFALGAGASPDLECTEAAVDAADAGGAAAPPGGEGPNPIAQEEPPAWPLDPAVSGHYQADVFTWTTDQGTCVVLPRWDENTQEIKLLGVICAATPDADGSCATCFWDKKSPFDGSPPVSVELPYDITSGANGNTLA